MKGEPIYLLSDARLPMSGIQVYLPDINGIQVPPDCAQWVLEWDQRHVPAASPIEFQVDMQRAAWVDKAGIAHPNGEWIRDMGHPLGFYTGGFFIPHFGNQTATSVNFLRSTIGAIDGDGNMVEPYPIAARVRINRADPWLLPFMRITFF